MNFGFRSNEKGKTLIKQFEKSFSWEILSGAWKFDITIHDTATLQFLTLCLRLFFWKSSCDGVCQLSDEHLLLQCIGCKSIHVVTSAGAVLECKICAAQFLYLSMYYSRPWERVFHLKKKHMLAKKYRAGLRTCMTVEKK